MYHDLVKYFYDLDIVEKSFLFLYKTDFGRLIDMLNVDNNEELIQIYYEKYKGIVSTDAGHYFASLYRHIDFESLESFSDSVYKMRDTLTSAYIRVLGNKEEFYIMCRIKKASK